MTTRHNKYCLNSYLFQLSIYDVTVASPSLSIFIVDPASSILASEVNSSAKNTNPLLYRVGGSVLLQQTFLLFKNFYTKIERYVVVQEALISAVRKSDALHSIRFKSRHNTTLLNAPVTVVNLMSSRIAQLSLFGLDINALIIYCLRSTHC